jgi:dTDP-4-amino-4,6-dideoxygalactose transaminase
MKNLEPFDKPIYVTKPFLPPLEDYTVGLKEIWNSQWLTNRGPILKNFEAELRKYLELDQLCLFTNGTLALQIGLQGMKISGEVITTPFTFVATTHALYWNKIQPIFCDVEPDYYTIDPDKIEDLITPETSAILAVNVFGHPCKHDQLSKIASNYNLKLIYDSAHAFGVKIGQKPIGVYGDMNMYSFHATKLFHSIEGGMLSYKNPNLTEVFNYLKNFGFKNETEVMMPGTNAKMNEFQALMGVQNLKNVDRIIQKKRKISQTYKEKLVDIPGIGFSPEMNTTIQQNYSYVPVQIDPKDFGLSRDQLYSELKKFNIFTRRYFYPLVSDFPCYSKLGRKSNLTVSRTISNRILTLPTYYDLSIGDVEKICGIIASIRNRFT